MTHEMTPVQMLGALPLFADKDTHHIARSCCMGLIPCRAFADDPEHPRAAIVVLQQLGISFAAGDAKHAPTLLEELRDWHPWYEVNEPPEDWYPALAAWSKESHATVRYAFTNDPAAFDLATLRSLCTLPAGCEMRAYDKDILALALAEGWSEDQIGAFASQDAFLTEGMGLAILKDGKLLSGCASFCCHVDGYEIQVDTHPDYRGQGLATCVSAAFILEALVRGKTPYWDAANSKSLRLAEKLGFVFTRAFPAWILISPKTTPEAVAQSVIG